MMKGLLILAILGVASTGLFGQGQHTSEPAPVVAPAPLPIITVSSTISGVWIIKGIKCIISDAVGTATGAFPSPIGSSGLIELGTGVATTLEGRQYQLSNGLVHFNALSPADVQGIRLALAQSDLTYEAFVQQVGAFLPGEGILEITAGVIALDGVYRNIDVGVLAVRARSVLGKGPVTGPITGPVTGPITGPTTGPVTGPVIGRQFIVTVTASPVTKTIRQPVTLIKTTTLDRYITITSPVYNSVAATITNVVKQTVFVTEDQVIRSQLPGRLVVKTVPGETQVVLTVTDTDTQYFVQTAFETVTSTLQHLAPTFNFSTVTVNNPQTSTVVQIITRTSVTTALVTSTLDSTIHSTVTAVFTVTADSINASTPGYY